MYPVNRTATEDPPLLQFLRLCRRHWLLIGITTIVGAGVALGVTLRADDVYVSESELLVSAPSQAESTFVDQPLSADPDRRIENETELIESGGTRQHVEEAIGRSVGVSARTGSDSDVITVSTSAGSPEVASDDLRDWVRAYVQIRRETEADDLRTAATRARDALQDVNLQLEQVERPLHAAEATVAAAIPGTPEQAAAQAELDRINQEIGAQIAQLESQRSTLRDQVNGLESEAATLAGSLSVITPASTPTSPEAAGLPQAGLLGAVVGLLVGLGLAVGKDQLDRSIRTADDLRKVRPDIPVLGTVPRISGREADDDRPVVLASPRSPAAEAYRGIAASLGFLEFEHASGALQITSPVSGDGKTTLTANLGIALARTGQEVILLDADLRRPMLHHRFGVTPTHGTFGDSLVRGVDPIDTCMSVDVERLSLVPALPTDENPADLLQSDVARKVIERLGQQCDILIIDSPPVLAVADSLIIGRHVDRAVLVTAAGSTQRDQILEAIRAIESMRTEVTGVVLNGAASDATYATYYSQGD